MDCEVEKVERRRRGPSNYALSFSGIVAVAGLLASGVATYNSVQNDIATLKRDIVYQERTNELNRQDRIAIRSEQRESFRELDSKMERLIDLWSTRRGR